jgi:hypothetical protein
MTAPIEFTSKSKRVKALITTDGAVAIKDNRPISAKLTKRYDVP